MLLLFILVAKYLGVKCCNFRACTNRLNPGKLTPPTAGTQGSQEACDKPALDRLALGEVSEPCSLQSRD